MDVEPETNSFFSDLFGTKADSKSDLFSLSNHKINSFDSTSDITIKNLTLEDNINSTEYSLGSYNFLGNELESISIRDSASVENTEEIDEITGNNFDRNIQLRAGQKSDNKIDTATEIDIVSGEKVKINDRIGYKKKGKVDKYDYYSFGISENMEVSIDMDKLQKNANLHLFNESGKKVLAKSNKKGKKSENITEYLDAGDYYLRVSAVGNAKTPYRLILEKVPDDKNIDGANDLGKLSQKELKVNDKIGYKKKGKVDKYDYYSFGISEDMEVNIEMDKLQKNANLHLFDESGKKVLAKSNKRGKKSENITEYLDAGDYYLRVSAVGNAKTPYRLILENVPDDKSIDGANNLGKLFQKELKVNDKIGYRENGKRDGIDLYFFEINQEQEVDINLNKLKQNSNLRLIDEDGETVLDKSTNKGKNSEKITEVLEPGIYYVEVSARGNDKTNYELSLSSQEVNTVFPSVLETYESGTRVGFENRVSLEIPEGWVGKQKSMFETIFEGRSFVDGQYFPFTLTSTKYPDVYVELSVRSNYLTGLIQNLANTWAIDETTYEPQGKAKVKGNQITNTYTAKNSISQEKYYVVSTVGPNDEIATVTVGGSVNKLKDYKDIANDVVESLDFPEPTDWESFLSDHWLAYAPYGSLYEAISLHDDLSFHHDYLTTVNRLVTWDMTRKDELVLRYENGEEKVGQLDGPSVYNNIIYGGIVYEAKEKP